MFSGKCGKKNTADGRFCVYSSTNRSAQTPSADHSLDALGVEHTVCAGALRQGQVVAGRYEIEQRLGSGGMGEEGSRAHASCHEDPVTQ